MENMTRKVERMVRKNAKRRAWRRFVAIPAAIVVFVTTYALILPAIALERDTYCGFEAHQHTEECYTAQLTCGYEDGHVLQSTKTVTELACTASAHQHTEDCFNEYGEIVCGQADYLVHEHNADCYNEAGQLVCPLPEVKAHTHDASCYVTEIVNVCGLEESAGHVHDESCYTVVSHPELICGQEESAGHVHDASCYTTTEHTYLACGQVESAGHIHDENCYTVTVAEDGTETMELTCGQMETIGHTHTDACYVTEQVTELTCTLPESAGHTHTDACWADVQSVELTCGKAESAGHTHTDACYAEQSVLICPLPEVIPHVHGDECYTVTVAEDGTEVRELTCPLTVVESHQHTADCFTTYEMTVETPHHHSESCYIHVLTCTLPEHEHTEECYQAPEQTAAPAVSAELESEGFVGGFDDPEIFDETVPSPEPVPETPVASAEAEATAEPETTEIPAEAGSEPEVTEVPAEPEATEEPAEPQFICGKDEHTHDEACYDENGELVCQIEEHTHDETCLPVEITGDELSPVEPEYICGKEEHTHDEACYDENGELVCEIEEHTHDASCQAAEITGGNVEIVEDNTPQFVMPELVCGMTEHEHSTNCMDEHMNYACGLTQHTHTGECYDIPGLGVHPILVCDKHEHFHTEACYNEAGELVCGREAHLHDVDCFALPQTDIMTLDLDGIMLTALDGFDGWGDFMDYVSEVTGTSPSVSYDPATDTWNSDIHIEFKDLPIGDLLKYKNFYLELPDGVDIPDGINGHLFYGEAGGDRDAFTFTVHKEGDKSWIEIEFSQDYLDTLKNPTPNQTASGYLQFNAEGKRGKGPDVDVHFSTDVNLHIDEDKLKREYEFKGEKTGSWEKDGDTLKYTVTVESRKGTPGPVELDDLLTVPDALKPYIGEPRLDSVTHSWVNAVTGEVVSSEPDSNTYGFTANETGYTMTLPQMKVEERDGVRCGERYTITYEYDISDVPPGTQFNLNNSAHLHSEDTTGNKLEQNFGHNVTVEKKVLEKEGQVDAEGNIEWTITVNKDGVDIAGWELSDEMFDDAIDGTLDWNPKNGVSREDNKFVFSAVDGDKNEQTYTFTYKTKAGIGTYVNDAGLTDPNPGGKPGEWHAQGQVGVNNGKVTKEFKEAVPGSENTVLTWELNITIPEEGIMKGTLITEEIKDDSGQGNHWMTKAQIDDLIAHLQKAGINVAVTGQVHLSNPWADKYYNELEGTECVTKFTLEVLEDVKGAKNFTLQYNTTLPNDYTTTVRNNFWGAEDEYTPTPPPTSTPGPLDKTNGNGQDNGTLSLDPDHHTITWVVTIRPDKFYEKLHVKDVLPDGVKLSSIEFQIGTTYVTYKDEDVTDNKLTFVGSYGGAKYLAGEGEVTLDGDQQVLNFNIKGIADLYEYPGWSAEVKKDTYSRSGDVITVKYTCEITDEEFLELLDSGKPYKAQTYSNTVTVEFDDRTETDTDVQTVPEKVSSSGMTEEKFNKTGRYNSEQGRIHYYVDICADTSELPPGSTMTLTDKLDYYVHPHGSFAVHDWNTHDVEYYWSQDYTLSVNSVKLYKAKLGADGKPLVEDNHYVPDEDQPIDIKVVYSQEYRSLADDEKWPYTGQWVKTIRIEYTDPDPLTPLVLVYDYLPEITVIEPGHEITMNPHNTAELESLHDEESGYWKWEKVTGGGAIYTNGLTISKVDAENAKLGLPNTEFTLYLVGKNDAEDVKITTAMTNSAGNLSLTYDEEDKVFKVNGEAKPDITLEKDTLYYWEETNPARGYGYVDGEAPRVYFWYLSEDANETELRDAFGAKDLYIYDLSETTHTAMVTNVQTHEYVLPETGGMGTQVFTLSGMALIALAGAVFCARRRRAARG